MRKTPVLNNETGLVNVKILPVENIITHVTGDTYYQLGVDIPTVINPVDGTMEMLVTAVELQAHAEHDLQMFEDLTAEILNNQFTDDQIQAIVDKAIEAAEGSLVSDTDLNTLIANYSTTTQMTTAISTAIDGLDDDLDTLSGRISTLETQSQDYATEEYVDTAISGIDLNSKIDTVSVDIQTITTDFGLTSTSPIDVQTGSVWSSAEDPSPTGWRVPTMEDYRALTDTFAGTWETRNGQVGRCYGSPDLFFSAAGSATEINGTYGNVDFGHYWSATASDAANGYQLYFSQNDWEGWDEPTNPATLISILSIRCVRDVATTDFEVCPAGEIQIGNVIWAKSNLEDTGIFCKTETDKGGWFQWGSAGCVPRWAINIGLPYTGELVTKDEINNITDKLNVVELFADYLINDNIIGYNIEKTVIAPGEVKTNSLGFIFDNSESRSGACYVTYPNGAYSTDIAALTNGLDTATWQTTTDPISFTNRRSYIFKLSDGRLYFGYCDGDDQNPNIAFYFYKINNDYSGSITTPHNIEQVIIKPGDVFISEMGIIVDNSAAQSGAAYISMRPDIGDSNINQIDYENDNPFTYLSDPNITIALSAANFTNNRSYIFRSTNGGVYVMDFNGNDYGADSVVTFFRIDEPLALVKRKLENTVTSQRFGVHTSTDMQRWAHEYEETRKSYIRDAASDGLKPDYNSTVTVSGPVSGSTVSDEYGGLLGITIRNKEVSGTTTYATITINKTDGSTETYSSDGLPANMPITVYFWPESGDTYSAIGAVETQTYTPFIPDSDSLTAKRMQALMDFIVQSNAATLNTAIEQAKAIYAGTDTLNYDLTNPTTIIGNGGIITVGGGQDFTITQNGAIQCQASAVLQAKSVVITYANGDPSTTWTAPLLLGLVGSKNPSDFYRVSTGDVVSLTGVLGVGDTINVTFYPNKPA